MRLSALNQLLADSHVEDRAELLDRVLHRHQAVSQALAGSHPLRDSRPMQRTLRRLHSDPRQRL